MTEFQEGDLVEAVKGESIIRGRLESVPSTGSRPVLALTVALHSDLLHLTANGYTVTLIDRPKPKVELPTEDCTVISARVSKPVGFLPAGWMHNLILHSGTWRSMNGAAIDPETMSEVTVVSEPVPVTARRVFERLDAASMHEGNVRDGAWRTIHDSNWHVVAVEFGVTND